MISQLKRNARLLILAALFLGLLASCREPEQNSTPTVTPAIAVVAGQPSPAAVMTPMPDSTATPLPIGADAYLPVIKDDLPPTATQTPVPPPSPTPTPAFPTYDGPPLRRDLLGLQVHIHREDLRQIIRQLSQLEVGWVKVQVSWKLYESQPDTYTEDRFAELDALVEAANGQGIQVLLGVSKAPEWSRPTTEMDGPPADYAEFETFMRYLSDRYAGRVAAYELWNEPNLQREWNGVPLDAADLVALVAAGARGARAGDPEAVLISAAPATTGINDSISAIDDRVYLRSMLSAGVGEVVDAIGVHPYGWANPPRSSYSNPDTSIPSHNNHPSFFFLDTLDDYEVLLQEFGVALPLWVTEFGWGSFDQIRDDAGDPADPPAGAEFMAYTDEWQQADYILTAFQMGQERETIGPMILWNLNFGPLLGNEFSESGYSILRPDNDLRAAYRSLRAAEKW